jgi:hypothetical protein
LFTKKTLLTTTTLLLAFGGAALAQTAKTGDKDGPKTQMEGFLARKGSIVVKEFHPLGTINGDLGTAKFDTLSLYQPGKEQQRIMGIRVEVTEAGRLERSNTSFLDLEEIDSLMKGLDYMSKVVTEWNNTKRDYTEMIFSTKGDFQVGFYIEDGKVQPFIKSGSIASATAFVPTSAFDKMHQFLDRGRSLLAASDHSL